jgi:hypothetical protein
MIAVSELDGYLLFIELYLRNSLLILTYIGGCNDRTGIVPFTDRKDIVRRTCLAVV